MRQSPRVRVNGLCKVYPLRPYQLALCLCLKHGWSRFPREIRWGLPLDSHCVGCPLLAVGEPKHKSRFYLPSCLHLCASEAPDEVLEVMESKGSRAKVMPLSWCFSLVKSLPVAFSCLLSTGSILLSFMIKSRQF